jgi:hypothetical protein
MNSTYLLIKFNELICKEIQKFLHKTNMHKIELHSCLFTINHVRRMAFYSQCVYFLDNFCGCDLKKVSFKKVWLSEVS